MGWHLVVAGLGAILVTWLALVCVLTVARPESGTLQEAVRIVPDTIRLVRRLAADPTVTGVRIRLWFLLVYLISPIDIVPDFIPVIGFADDALITALVLRSVVRRAGPEVLQRHWPGTPEGYRALTTLCRLPTQS